LATFAVTRSLGKLSEVAVNTGVEHRNLRVRRMRVNSERGTPRCRRANGGRIVRSGDEFEAVAVHRADDGEVAVVESRHRGEVVGFSDRYEAGGIGGSWLHPTMIGVC